MLHIIQKGFSKVFIKVLRMLNLLEWVSWIWIICVREWQKCPLSQIKKKKRLTHIKSKKISIKTKWKLTKGKVVNDTGKNSWPSYEYKKQNKSKIIFTFSQVILDMRVQWKDCILNTSWKLTDIKSPVTYLCRLFCCISALVTTQIHAAE